MSTLKRKAGSHAGGADAKKVKQDGNIMSFFGAPKPGPLAAANKNTAAPAGAASQFSTAIEPPPLKFDKEKWVASLTTEQKKLLQLEIDTLHESWLAHLKDEITSKEFLELKRFLEREYSAGKKVFPPKEDIYSWSRLTPFSNVRVVILGQDPYHNVNQAHGLAFSVRPPTPAPPSLRNMYTCLRNDYPSFVAPPNKGGLLTPWAERGVLMLNTCLTVRAHEANSHSNRGWEKFTQKVIDTVAAKRTRGVVFMAWGTPAGKRVIKIDAKKHLVLKSVHPSPLSASRGFFNCKHFKLANEWLNGRYGSEGRVDWALVEGQTIFAEGSEGSERADEDGSQYSFDEEAEREMLALVNGNDERESVTKKVEAVVKASVIGKKLDVKELIVTGKEVEVEGDENADPAMTEDEEGDEEEAEETGSDE
ncbi:uracil-DNA glycosylase [Podospora fimiseda]|uniref:Uracil-DNA glycosylase n=1 Tax=Podospora fimiseda TaxID=252190 RepID=A0AAN7H4T2_9PEZI|nr:uracil-DNA glycosylase [Podospora fimiseda]